MTQAVAPASTVDSNVDAESPARMKAAGIPLALARWYHLVGRRLRKFSEWDVERVMQVRLQLARLDS